MRTPTEIEPLVKRLIEAQVPLTFINALDEKRVEAMIRRITKSTGRLLYVWTITRGFQPEFGGAGRHQFEVLNKICTSEDRTVFLLKDLNLHFTDPYIIRLLKDIALKDKNKVSTFVVGEKLEVPPKLVHHSLLLEMPPPTTEEVRNKVKEIISRLNRFSKPARMTEEDIEWVVKVLVGMTDFEIDTACEISLTAHQTLDPDELMNFRMELASRRLIESHDAMPQK